MEIEAGSFGYQLEHRRLTQQTTPPRFMRTPNHNVANAMIAGKFEKRVDRFFRPQSHDFGAQVSGSLFVFQKIALQRRVDTVAGFAFR